MKRRALEPEELEAIAGALWEAWSLEAPEQAADAVAAILEGRRPRVRLTRDERRRIVAMAAVVFTEEVPALPLDAASRKLARELAAIPYDPKEWAEAEALAAAARTGKKRP